LAGLLFLVVLFRSGESCFFFFFLQFGSFILNTKINK